MFRDLNRYLRWHYSVYSTLLYARFREQTPTKPWNNQTSVPRVREKCGDKAYRRISGKTCNRIFPMSNRAQSPRVENDFEHSVFTKASIPNKRAFNPIYERVRQRKCVLYGHRCPLPKVWCHCVSRIAEQ